MHVANRTTVVSIRFNLTLEDGTLINSTTVGGDRFDYIPGLGQILPAIEEALRGAVRGEKKQITLSPDQDPGMKLAVTRLAHLLGHAGETIIAWVELV